MEKHKRRPGEGVEKILLYYWVVLVAWQNFGGGANGSAVDTALKIVLLGALTLFYLSRARTVNGNILLILPFSLCMMVTFWLSGDAASGRSLILYLYPVLLVFLAYGIGSDFQIDKKGLCFFLNGVILVTAYAAVYAIVFRTDKFIRALSMQAAYGNELTSFFVSNHEYGMYLVYGVVSCGICIELDREKNKRTKVTYLLLAIFFIVNLLLTFSRTSILAMLVVGFLYCLFKADSKLRKWLLLGAVAAVILAIFSQSVRNALDILIFKGKRENSLSGRDVLAEIALTIFNDGALENKAFGFGYSVRAQVELYAGRGSTHNAYLQVLLYFGAVGLTFMVGVLLARLKANISLRRKSRFFSVIFVCMLLAGMAMMATNTAIIFTSQVDSYFLTVVSIIVPKYVSNALWTGTFEKDE